MHVILWRYRARPGREAEFEATYGADGAWERLFREGRGYLGTELLRASDGAYLTMDRWESAAAAEAFRAAFAARYDELDARCAALTDEEAPLGGVEV